MNTDKETIDDVTRTITALDEQLTRIAHERGVPFANYELGGLDFNKAVDDAFERETVMKSIGAFFALANTDFDFVSMVKFDGTWGLHYHRRPITSSTASSVGRPDRVVRLKDAPGHVRRLFCVAADDFVTKFIARVKAETDSQAKYVEAGNRALAKLKNM